jgi:hypothetical protein
MLAARLRLSDLRSRVTAALPLIAATALTAAAVWTSACAPAHPSSGSGAASASRAGVTLEAEVPQPGLVVMRAPSFR